MIDHIGIEVSDFDRSREFYEEALEPLGLRVLEEPLPDMAGFGEDDKAYFWIATRGRPVVQGVHVAFAARDRAVVDAFHAAALDNGGTDNGAPGVREIFGPNYYAAFALDPDGNNIEAVCQSPPE